MELKEIQENLEAFLEDRGWLNFSPSDVFIHLQEELGEIGKHILFQTGYKKEEMGHKKPKTEELPQEIAQAFSLFLQLCLILEIDLENSWISEFKRMKKRFH